MASTPSRPLREPAPVVSRGEDDVRRPKDEQGRRAHRDQVKASMAWALDEYAATLAKLAK